MLHNQNILFCYQNICKDSSGRLELTYINLKSYRQNELFAFSVSVISL